MRKMVLKTPVKAVKVRLSLSEPILRELREVGHSAGIGIDEVAEQAIQFAFSNLEKIGR